FIGAQRRPDLAKRFLSQVSGIVVVAAEPAQIRIDALVMQCEQLRCGLAISRFGPFAECLYLVAHVIILQLLSRKRPAGWTKIFQLIETCQALPPVKVYGLTI